MHAVIMIMLVSRPKCTVGEKLLSATTPNPMHNMAEEDRMALPLISIV